MNPQKLVSILLVVFVLCGESSVHGGKNRVSDGEENIHEVVSNVQKRAVYKKGDHLFNNIARAFTKMIQDIFEQTTISNFCAARPGDQFLVEDTTANGRDVTAQFPSMAQSFRQYKTDKLLTTDRDSLSVYGQAHTGPDDNAIQWSANIEDLRRRVFELINRLIAFQIQGQQKPGQSLIPQGRQKEIAKESLKLQDNIREKINQIVNGQEYVDRDARRIFMQDKNNKNKFDLVREVEQHSKAVLDGLPAKANQWGVEAANFVKKKFSGKK